MSQSFLALLNGFHSFTLLLWKAFYYLLMTPLCEYMCWHFAVSFQKLYNKCNCIFSLLTDHAFLHVKQYATHFYPLVSALVIIIESLCHKGNTFCFMPLTRIATTWQFCWEEKHSTSSSNYQSWDVISITGTNVALFSPLNLVSEVNEVRMITCRWDVWTLWMLSVFILKHFL